MLHYEEYGNRNGKPVVFIHGGFTTSESYRKQYELLPDFHCVYVDLSNHGKSFYGNSYCFTYDGAAQEVIALINKLSPEKKVIIVSHSYGGLVTKLLLEKIPERIEKVVVGSTNVKKTPLFWVYTRMAGCFFLWSQNRERYQRENISWKLVREIQKDAWKNFHISQEPCEQTIQALLLYAEYDIHPIKQSMHLWQKHLPHSRIYMLPKADHNYFWNQPEAVNTLLKEFIETETT